MGRPEDIRGSAPAPSAMPCSRWPAPCSGMPCWRRQAVRLLQPRALRRGRPHATSALYPARAPGPQGWGRGR